MVWNRDYRFGLDSSAKPDVSFRLTVALALLHLPLNHPLHQEAREKVHSRKRSKLTSGVNEQPLAKEVVDGDEEGILAPFMALVQGQSDNVSTDNARLCQESLLEICDMIVNESQAAIGELQTSILHENDILVGMLRQLWKNEAWFAAELTNQIQQQILGNSI